MVSFLDVKISDIYTAEAEILRAMIARNAQRDQDDTTAMLFGASPHVCFAISVARLVQRDYGEAGGDRANKVKLEAALDIFYVLVLIQATFVIYMIILARQEVCTSVSKQCRFGDWGPELVSRYREDTQVRCDKDECLPKDWNLVRYAVVLLESAAVNDRLSGVRVLDSLVQEGIVVRQEVLSSRQSFQNLMSMIDSPSSSEIRERAARTVAHLASDLLATQFPGALRCACSLLEAAHASASVEQTLDKKSNNVALEISEHSSHQEGAHLSLPITEQTEVVESPRSSGPLLLFLTIFLDVNRNDRYKDSHYTFVSKGTKELISQGLLIVERLTQDQDNCTAICNHPRLLSKITSPIMTYQDLHSNVYDQTWVEMLSRPLTVVSRLIISPGDGAARLRHGISSNPVAVRNLMGILESGSEGVREQALEILTELAFEESFREQSFHESGTATSMMEKLLQILGRILFEDAKQDGLKHKRLTGKAGEALARLLAIPSVIGTTDASVAEANGHGNAVDLLTKVLQKMVSTKTEAAGDAVTKDVASNGSTVETIMESQPPPQDTETEEQSEERKLIAAMLSLTVVICTKCAISEDGFARAAPEDAALVKKLKEIIKTNQDIKPGCLKIVKLSCKVVKIVAQHKPSCIEEFKRDSFDETLSEALETLSDLDNFMLFAGDGREVTSPVMSLASLVEEAKGAIQQST